MLVEFPLRPARYDVNWGADTKFSYHRDSQARVGLAEKKGTLLLHLVAIFPSEPYRRGSGHPF
jgi:hypothetical protein